LLLLLPLTTENDLWSGAAARLALGQSAKSANPRDCRQQLLLLLLLLPLLFPCRR
jgi:hypothetical protein